MITADQWGHLVIIQSLGEIAIGQWLPSPDKSFIIINTPVSSAKDVLELYRVFWKSVRSKLMDFFNVIFWHIITRLFWLHYTSKHNTRIHRKWYQYCATKSQLPIIYQNDRLVTVISSLFYGTVLLCDFWKFLSSMVRLHIFLLAAYE